MHMGIGQRTSVLIALLVLGVFLAACGGGSPTPLDSPLEPVESPLTEPTTPPTTPPTAAATEPSQQQPAATPDPGRTPVVIAEAEIGPDREVVTIKNVSETEQDISKWTLFNRDRMPLFVFPDGFMLQPGETTQVYSAVSEAEVPDGALFWTEEKIWLEFPANVMLLNRQMRLVYWHTEGGGQ